MNRLTAEGSANFFVVTLSMLICVLLLDFLQYVAELFVWDKQTSSVKADYNAITRQEQTATHSFCLPDKFRLFKLFSTQGNEQYGLLSSMKGIFTFLPRLSFVTQVHSLLRQQVTCLDILECFVLQLRC